MKKTFPININGQIFYIDEDAYTLLQNYLKQLRATFTGDEGAEIVDDIESRIHEHFSEKLSRGVNVITLSDVNSVIETMGRPEELDENSVDENHSSDGADTEENAPREGSMPPPPPPADDKPFISINLPSRKRLFRNMQNKVFGGVIGGLATYLGWNAIVMRLLLFLCVIFTSDYLLLWVVIYLIAWMTIPAAVSPRQILEMRGQPVNVDTVGRTVLQTPPPYDGHVPVEYEREGFFSTFFSILGKCLMAFVGLVSSVISVGIVVLIISMLVLLTTHGVFDMTAVIPETAGLFRTSQMVSAMTIAWSMVFLIPAIALVWTSCCVVFNAPSASRSTKVTAIVLEVLFIIAAVVLTLIGSASVEFPFRAVTMPMAAGMVLYN
jgi:phage shock protein PspC (stress-responsive transcriptional regulator)